MANSLSNALEGRTDATKGRDHWNRQTAQKKLLESRIGPYTAALTAVFEDRALAPGKAGAFSAVLPWFADFHGVEHIAAVALNEALHWITEAHTYTTFCQFLGKAIQREQRYMLLEKEEPMVARRMQKTFRSKAAIVSNDALKALDLAPQSVANQLRVKAGAMLLETMLASTDLLQIRKRRTPAGHYQRIVVSTPETEAFLRALHVRQVAPREFLQEGEVPRDWAGIFSDRELTEDSLVQLPVHQRHDRRAYAYLEEDGLARHIQLANAVQRVGMRVDPWMVDLQRQAWEAGITGLFPCKRTPEDLPSTMGVLLGAPGYKVRAREMESLELDLWKNRGRRIRIERAVQAGEAMAGGVAHARAMFDFRGRLYARGALVSPQGTQHEKAMLTFAEEGPVGPAELEWMLWAAAGHWGQGKLPRQERIRWGRDNLPLMRSLVEAPLDRLELWRSCKEPWLFLQLARAIVLVEQGAQASGVPIRMDQTISGLGIIATLTRDLRLAGLTNVVGDTREDLYLQVLALLLEQMRRDVESPEPGVASAARRALQLEPDRALVKQVVLALPYGLRPLGVTKFCEEWIEEKVGFVPFDEYRQKIGSLANYTSRTLRAVAKEAIGDTLAIDKWLASCVKKAIGGGREWFGWTTPAGMPVRLSAREKRIRSVSIRLRGREVSMNVQEQGLEQPVSAAETAKGIGAHFIHSMESGVCQAVLEQLLAAGAPIVTAHDCFATRPSDAQLLKETLHATFRGVFLPDRLAMARTEIELEAGMAMPPHPWVGDLPPERIGENDFLYS